MIADLLGEGRTHAYGADLAVGKAAIEEWQEPAASGKVRCYVARTADHDPGLATSHPPLGD